MKSLIATIDRGTARLSTLIEWLCIALLTTSASIAFVGVVLRYGFGESDQLLEELSRYTILYACFLLVGPCLRRGQHISVDVLSGTFSPAVRRFWEFGLRLLFLVMAVIVFRSGWIWVADQYRYGLTIFGGTMPAWLPAMSVPLGTGVAVLFGLSEVFTSLFAAITGQSAARLDGPSAMT